MLAENLYMKHTIGLCIKLSKLKGNRTEMKIFAVLENSESNESTRGAVFGGESAAALLEF